MEATEVKYCTRCNRPITANDSTIRGIGACCEAKQGYVYSPFKIVVDSNETYPYTFAGIEEDANRGNAIIIPQMTRKPMYLKGLADYSIEGLERNIQIERKSKSDLFSTFGQRRDHLEGEFGRMNATCEIAYFLVEAEWKEILLDPPRHSRLNPKTITRTHDSWMIKYPKVHWVMCAGRRHAEIKTYRLLAKFYDHWIKREKEARNAVN